MNEKFFSLSQEKKDRIVRCAYEVFSQNSYKEASMSKIVDAGGISKSLLFHYFLNKKELYLYLWEKAEKLFSEINRQYYRETSVFFEAIRQRFLAGVRIYESLQLYFYLACRLSSGKTQR